MAYPTPATAASHAYKYTKSCSKPCIRSRSRLCALSNATHSNHSNHSNPAPSSQDYRACPGDSYNIFPVQNRRVSDIIQATGRTPPAHSQRSPPIGQPMQLFQYQAQSASSSTAFSEDPSRPPVPLFSENSHSIPLHTNMVIFPGTNMEGRHTTSSSLSPFLLTTRRSGFYDPRDLALAPEMGQPSFADPHYNEYQDSPATLSMEHSSSADSHTMDPAEMHLISPGSTFMTYQSTPQTPFLEESPNGQVFYSNDVSPAYQSSDSPAIDDSLEFNPAVDTAGFFPSLEFVERHKGQITAPEPTEKKSTPMSRKVSSPSKTSPSSRLSLSSGITKKKRRNKVPLPDIPIIDPNDPAEIKKKRNTMAARKSRDKKELQKEALTELCIIWKQQAYARGYRPEDEEEEARLEKVAGLRE
ncbi:MAG: hypothetical protein Q9184_004283 [Pyrenodesmia sp. 2 TL-2023]